MNLKTVVPQSGHFPLRAERLALPTVVLVRSLSEISFFALHLTQYILAIFVIHLLSLDKSRYK